MEQFIEGQNPYEILELKDGQQSSLEAIKKAYRRLALVKHPDKNKKSPNAAQEFDELKKAYAILSDKSARGALDDYLEAHAHRERRLAQQDAKRQKLRQDLERKEREGEKTRSEEEQARARLKVELEALRARAQQEQRDRQQQQQQAAAAAAAAAAARARDSAGAGPSGRPAVGDGAGGGDDDETTQLLQRTVKVTWDPTVGSYSTERLRQLFGEEFLVEDVILKDSRKKKKASALVVLDSVQAAAQAAHQVLGDLKNPLLITPYLKVMPDAQQQSQQGQQGQQPAAKAAEAGAEASRHPVAPLFAAGGVAGAGTGGRAVQRPSKPLFPSAQPMARQDAPAAAAAGHGAACSAEQGAAAVPAGAGSGSSKPGASFSSFPGMPPAAPGSKGFSSFPGMPTGGFEQSVLQKLQQKSQHKQQ